MIKSQLHMALDSKHRKGVPYELYTYRVGEQWFIVSTGPRHSNTFEVIEYDYEGLALLKRKERKLDTPPEAISDREGG